MLPDTQLCTGKDKRLLVLLSFGILVILFHFFTASTPVNQNQPHTKWIWFEGAPPDGELYRRKVNESIADNATTRIGPTDIDRKSAIEGTLSPRALFLLGFPLPINRAGLQELQMLPGIGPKLAQRISAYRQRHGSIRNKDSFRQVSGIGPRLTDRLSPLLNFEVK